MNENEYLNLGDESGDGYWPDDAEAAADDNDPARCSNPDCASCRSED